MGERPELGQENQEKEINYTIGQGKSARLLASTKVQFWPTYVVIDEGGSREPRG
jgi:hypothetical protein